jgi:hypothetical protein
MSAWQNKTAGSAARVSGASPWPNSTRLDEPKLGVVFALTDTYDGAASRRVELFALTDADGGAADKRVEMFALTDADDGRRAAATPGHPR